MYFPAQKLLETPYIEIHIYLLLVNFNLLLVLLHYAYHQISDSEIYIAITTYDR